MAYKLFRTGEHSHSLSTDFGEQRADAKHGSAPQAAQEFAEECGMEDGELFAIGWTHECGTQGFRVCEARRDPETGAVSVQELTHRARIAP